MTFRARNIKQYLKCPKLFLTDYEASEKGFPLIYFSESLIEAAKIYLGVNEEESFVGNTGDSSERTLAGLQNKTWAYLARFEKYNYRTKVSFLKKEDDGYIYYVICSVCYPHLDRARQIFVDKWLMEEHGLKIKEVKLVHLNANYVRYGDLDYQQLFVTSDCFYKENNKPGKLVNDALAEVNFDVLDVLNNMNECVEKGVEAKFQLECTKRGKCVNYANCFLDEALSDDSVLFLNGSRKKYDFYMAGKTRIQDLSFDEDIDGTAIQYAQYQAATKGKEYMDYAAVSEWLDDNLKYPLIYLDFEWDTLGIPMYDGMKPYDCLLFQYSIHIDDGQQLIHKEYLGNGGDSREDFLKHLINDIPKEGTLIAYNADGAEKIRLKELANVYPNYAEELEDLRMRMVDLSYPIMEGLYYHPQMRGTYSLKKLYALISNNHGYNELDIGHGLDAVQAYRMMSSGELDESVRQELLDYCGLDTYAMVALVKYFKDLIEAKNREYRSKYAHTFKFADFDEMLGKRIHLEIINKVKGNESELPFYYYNIMENDTNKVIGKISIRIGHNYHSYYNGNIGYEINEDYRGNHYALEAANLVLNIARHHGMKYLYISCHEDNEASKITIEKLGGVLVEVCEVPVDYIYYHEGMSKQRIYKVEL